MKVAIVAPLPEPFVTGGAENLWSAMIEWLNGEGGHEAELIKLPVNETTLARLVAGYEAFSRLDVMRFDAVISSKYPAWMVSHPNHSVYLQHTCRGYYDWYPRELETEYRGSDPVVIELLAFMARNRGSRAALAEFFDRFRALAAHPEVQRHPGPVGRAIIHFLDGVGLARSRIRRYAAIAEAVKRRPGYFPHGAKVAVVHHPTGKAGFRDASQGYFFTVSRFYPSKRIDLLIDAYRRTSIPLPFKIAGTGMEEEKLRAHAAGDPRIEFLGYVSDEQLIDLYNGAMAVPFAPADEDFGYVALEAMLAGKPVITTSDAGGPLELVRDGETGIVAAPDAASLAAAFERVYTEREWARAIGNRGFERARQVNWPAVFGTLLGEAPGDAPAVARAKRPRLTVLNAYAIHPPKNGGSYRIHWLYRALARHFDVDLVTLALEHEGSDVIWVEEGLRELRVARTPEHARADFKAQEHAHSPVYDITALESIHLTPDYLTVLEGSLAEAKLVALSHPYMLTALRKAGWKGPFIHESQNCEHHLKSLMLPKTDSSGRLLAMVEEAERFCVREAKLVYAASEDDAMGLVAQYGARPEDTIVIPNGTDVGTIPCSDAAERRRVRRRLGLGDQAIALFLASGHRPNLEAAEKLFMVAERMPEVAFALVGNSADAFIHRKLPANIWLVGTVTEEARNIWLQVASVALNPMLYGGGTNLKLLDYFAAGTPVVSTEIGIRGTGARHGRHLLVAPMEEIEGAIRRAVAGGPDIERMSAEARSLVEENFDWWKLGERLYEAIKARGLVSA